MAPLFILGLQRSGTTLLYEVFAASGAFNVSTTWHVICFDELRRGVDDVAASRHRLQERFAAAGLTTRGMDIVKIGPDTPEEYGFVLANRGLGMRITRRSLPVFEEFRGVVQRCSGADRPLVLKNTWDFGNAARIKGLVPGARFVFIHRNPFQIVSSLYRVVCKAVLKGFPYLELLSDRFARFAAGGLPRRTARLLCTRTPGLVARGVVHFVAHQARGYLRGLPALSPTDYINVRYEDLCAQPNETMARLLAFAGVDPDAGAAAFRPRGARPVSPEGRAAPDSRGLKATALDYRPMISPHATHVEPEIAARRRLVIRRFQRYALAAGYDLATLAEPGR